VLQNVVLEDGVTMLLGNSGIHEPSDISSLKNLSPNKTIVQTSNLLQVLAYQNMKGYAAVIKTLIAVLSD
jgi:hypothetical protein